MKISGFFVRMRGDFGYRAAVSSVPSLCVSVLYSGHNIFLGAVHGTAWNWGIAVYYVLLSLIRAYVGGNEIYFAKKAFEEEERERRRKKIFLAQSAALLVLGFALVAPIALMVLQKRYVNYSEVTAIAIAAYTVYKVTLSAVNLKKTRRNFHLGIKILKDVNFIDALVSVLNLQYTLVMTFGGGVEGDMFTLCAFTCGAVWTIIAAFSVYTFITAVKLNKK